MKTKENILLDEIEASQEYEAFRQVIEETLQDQWLDIISSGVIEEIFDEIGWPLQKAKTSAIRRLLNRYIASGLVKDFSKLQRWAQDKVSGRIKRVGQYAGYWMAIKTYLYHLFNKGWQAEIDKYLWIWKHTFSLSNTLLRTKLRERANTLYKDWSKTTANKFATQLIRWITAGDSRNQLINRLVWLNEGISRDRATMIVRTETTAAIEYMRYQTAKMNGTEWKIWWATLDERTSVVCRDTNGETVPVNAIFSCWVEHPPAHVNCRSHVEYIYDDYSEDIEKKKKKPYKFYQDEPDLKYPKGLNPEYIWVGWNSYLGKDRDMDKYIGMFDKDDYKNAPQKHLATLSELVSLYPTSSLLDVKEFRNQVSQDLNLSMMERYDITSRTSEHLAIIMAKAKLTDKGFIQLIRKL